MWKSWISGITSRNTNNSPITICVKTKPKIIVDNNPTRTATEKNAIDLSFVLQKKYNNLTVEYQPKKR